MPHLIFILVAIVMIALVILGLRQAAKRRQALTAWAARCGLRFSPHKDHGFDDRYPTFKCLRQGGSRYAHNTISGQINGLAIMAFDYHYATGSGKNRSQHHFSAVILESPILLKPLSIRREHFFDELQKKLANTEDRIQAARRFYNGNVREMNTRVEVFPSNIIAGMFSFKKEEFFEISEASVRTTPDVSI